MEDNSLVCASILQTIKKLLGLSESYTDFDLDIITHINSVFGILNQMGVGPDEPFMITGEEEKWSDFISDTSVLETVKSYIYLKVKLLFDVPSNSYTTSAITAQINELEWRLYTHQQKEY